MTTTSITSAQLSQVQALVNQQNVAGAWQLLSTFGDQYATSAYQVIANPTSSLGATARNAWFAAGISSTTFNADFNAVALQHLTNYVNNIQANPTGNGDFLLPNTTFIEGSYIDALQDFGLSPYAAIDSSLAVISDNTGSLNWYNLLNIDPSRIGPTSSAVTSNISLSGATNLFAEVTNLTIQTVAESTAVSAEASQEMSSIIATDAALSHVLGASTIETNQVGAFTFIFNEDTDIGAAFDEAGRGYIEVNGQMTPIDSTNFRLNSLTGNFEYLTSSGWYDAVPNNGIGAFAQIDCTAPSSNALANISSVTLNGDFEGNASYISGTTVFVNQSSDVDIIGDDDYIDTYDDSDTDVDGSDDDMLLSSYDADEPNGGYDGDGPLTVDGDVLPDDIQGLLNLGNGNAVSTSNEAPDPPPGGVAKLPPGSGNNGGLGLSKAPTLLSNSVASLPNVFASSENEDSAQSALVQAEAVLSANGATALEAAQFEGATWSGGVITWSLASRSDSIGAQLTGVIGAQYSSLIQSAFQTWAAASGLKFVEVSDSSSTDIRLGWSNFNSESTGIVGYTGFDTQNSSFTPGVTISLENPAETPLVTDANGQLAYSGTETEFTQLLLHEIGHALGLADNADPNSIMYPILSDTNETLDATDIAGIQALYQPSTISATTASDTAAVTTGLTDIASLASSSPTTVASSLMSSLTSSALSPFAIEADQLIGSMAAFAPSMSPTTFIPSTFSVNSGLTLAAAGI